MGSSARCFLAVMKELNTGEKPLCLGFYRLMGSSQWPGHRVTVDGQGKTGLLRGCLNRAWPCGNHSGNLRGTLKQGVSVPTGGTSFQI